MLRTRISRTVIDVNRDPSGASLYPGQATTGLCPTETFDGEPLYRPGAEPDRRRDRGAPRDVFRAVSRGACRRDRAAAREASANRALRLPFDPLRRAAPLRRRAAAHEYRHEFRRRAATRFFSAAIEGICAASPLLVCRERPLQGRLDHAPLRRPGKTASTPCRWSLPAAATCRTRRRQRSQLARRL